MMPTLGQLDRSRTHKECAAIKIDTQLDHHPYWTPQRNQLNLRPPDTCHFSLAIIHRDLTTALLIEMGSHLSRKRQNNIFARSEVVVVVVFV